LGTKMAAFTDQQIADMLRDPKPIPCEFQRWLKPRKLRGKPKAVRRREVTGRSGRKYMITVRVNLANPGNFSVILSCTHHGKDLNLIRCNGPKHNGHTNHLEKKKRIKPFYIPPGATHVHRMTERYLDEPDFNPEHYAELCEEFSDLKSAVGYFVSNFGIYFRDGDYYSEHPLFDGNP
jgi:hypothetical protein